MDAISGCLCINMFGYKQDDFFKKNIQNERTAMCHLRQLLIPTNSCSRKLLRWFNSYYYTCDVLSVDLKFVYMQ
ncbi:hypothetical protein T4D_7054 [Trichinella pseudospiralis]|uniref:Uncharacterized protein n=1 Tax=Trichinella pseudospiralis TaxID=6337 RepID=A0A0V1FIA0_TRIPS|nr:hypothetical protein T4D_7054 [Trichinella pseudospiralis]